MCVQRFYKLDEGICIGFTFCKTQAKYWNKSKNEGKNPMSFYLQVVLLILKSFFKSNAFKYIN